jgi:hydrogenase maturation protease HycI
MFSKLSSRLKGKVIILGIGNELKSDDGAGSLLARRIQGKVPYLVYDAGVSPENYLGKIVKERPDTILVIDAADFSASPGDFNITQNQSVKTESVFFTHNSSLSLVINYLQNNLQVDIIILIIQPKTVVFGGGLSPEVNNALQRLEDWFLHGGKEG